MGEPENIRKPPKKDGTSTNPSPTIFNISLERAAFKIKAQQPSYTGSAKLIAKGRIVSKQTSSKHPNQNIRIKIRKSNLLDFQTSKRFHLGKKNPYSCLFCGFLWHVAHWIHWLGNDLSYRNHRWFKLGPILQGDLCPLLPPNLRRGPGSQRPCRQHLATQRKKQPIWK